jgi:glycosyltransferase involved in cell wall biosynthesis
MNVLLLSQFFSNTRGGGEYVFNLIAKKLAENNHKVWVITNKIKGEKYIEAPNLKLIFVPPTLEHKGGLPPRFSDNVSYIMNAIIKGLKIIKKEKIDVIHSNNFAPALSGSILSSLTSRPHITTIHDVFSLESDEFWKKWAKQNDVSKINAFLGPIFEKLMKNLRCSCIHTVSETTKGDLQKFGFKKPIYVIPNAIEYPNVLQNQINKHQFIFVGRLVFYKNLELIIKAINILKKTFPKIKLIIAGNGPQKKFLSNLVAELNLEDNIEFKGYVDTEEKFRLIAESNALVFPSLFEGFGLVILEAFSQNRPVLVSNKRPMSDIVSHKKNGYVLNSRDEKEWANAMEEMVNNLDMSNSMGKAGNDLLRENYSSDKMYEKILKMYQDVIL